MTDRFCPMAFILITPCIQPQGCEFDDMSLSLSDCYARSIAKAGGVPFILSRETDPEIVSECVSRADGVLLTGGEDVQPALYCKNLPKQLAATVKETDRIRDAIELQVIDEVFRLKRPLLAICRGHQLLNVALGGTLLVDIPSQQLVFSNMPAAGPDPVRSLLIVAFADTGQFGWL